MATPAGSPSDRAAGHGPGPAVFPFIGTNHPLTADLDAVRALIASDAGLAAGGAPGAVIHRELRMTPGDRGDLRLERFYWSVQVPDPAAPTGLRARTLLVDRRRDDGTPRVYDFPEDPRLPAASAPGGPLRPPAPGTVSVLRYIPLRRVTFRSTPPGGGERVIGKIKRRVSIERAHAQLTDVWRAVAASPGGFRVPAPRGCDPDRGVHFQEAVPGRLLVDELTGADAEGAIERFGAVHRELHGLRAGAPAADERARLSALAADVAWIGFAVPDVRGGIERVGAWVQRELARRPDAANAYCHGDFTPSQVIVSDGAWTVVDFDDAHRGDPYAEMGHVLAGMANEASPSGIDDFAAADRLRAAYLAGYQGSGRAKLDGPRLHVRRVAAGVEQLAMRLRKGRAAPGEAEVSVAGLLELTRF